MISLPTVFVSHGAPMLAIEPGATGPALSALGRALPRPQAILVISAHWETARPTVSAAEAPETIYDFGGFPDALYRLKYPAPGAPDLAARVKTLLDAAGFPADIDRTRGLDHGAWVPLRYLFPDSDVPVTQLSIQSQNGPDYHFRLGEALRPLREEGVLIIASGSLTHNLFELRMRGAPNPETAPYARDFQQWVFDRITANEMEPLIDYRKVAPQAARAHPTEEHFLPLFVALGAGDTAAARRVNDEMTYGALAMDAYVYGDFTAGA